MFYNQLIKLCELNGIKPTRLAKNLGFSPSNIKRWEEGVAVNSDMILKIAEYFQVPAGYFFQEDNEISTDEVEDEVIAFKVAFNALASHFDFIASFLSGYKISARDLSCIAKYMGKPEEFFVINKSFISNNEKNTVSRSPITLISDILNRLPGTKEYRYLQVQISRLIIQNLEGEKIYQSDLLKLGLLSGKIQKLYNPSIPSEKKKGLNLSDVYNIAWKCNLTLEYMLTGKEETVEQQNAT